LNTKHT